MTLHGVWLTSARACAWLEHNHDKDDFFLWVDTFDPHEPWDPPDYYVDMYDPDYIGQQVTYPQYHPIGSLTDEELLYSLQAEQKVAIHEEDYEMAARLRDKINSLKQKVERKD